jgi:uncharacterized protein YjgD (DUF1641 family)
MAEPIQFTPTPARVELTAREELDRLLESCHRHGVLRLANDIVTSNVGLAQTLMGPLRSEGAQNVIKNLGTLLMVLSQMPPDQFYRVVSAVADGLKTLLAAAKDEAPETEPPGLTGAYHMLHDEQLWRSLTPLVAALKSFSRRLDTPIENPISDFSGKPGRPS